MATAAVTPLASIFGSGFLVIVPVLERTLGALSVAGIAGVCLFVWFVGTAIRHNVATVEDADLSRPTRGLEEASDVVIVVAYVISVALYLRIMAQYVLDFAGGGAAVVERGVAMAVLVLIVTIAVTRGFAGLDKVERVALFAVLAIVAVLGGALAVHDAGDLFGDGVSLPPIPDRGIADVLLVLGGIVITVQGFETVRYLGDEFDADTRIKACRLSQLVAAGVYVVFVAVATPVMGLGTEAGADKTLLDITGRVVAFLSLPLVIAAVLSQFSAATADTVAADGNLRKLSAKHMRGARPFALSGIGAGVLIWTVPTFSLIAIASRAFAAYYALQCVVASRTSRGPARVGFGALALVLVAVTLLARPAE